MIQSQRTPLSSVERRIRMPRMLLVVFTALSAIIFRTRDCHVHGFVTAPRIRVFQRTLRLAQQQQQQQQQQQSPSISSPLLPPPLQPSPKKRRRRKTFSHGKYRNRTTRHTTSQKRQWRGKRMPDNIPKLSEILNGETGDDNGSDRPTAGILGTSTPLSEKRSEGTSTTSTTAVNYDASANSKISKDQSKQRRRKRQKTVKFEPWKAGYYTSIKTQRRIQNAPSISHRLSPLEQATAVLQTFLNTPPERCNTANVLCALTLSAKVRGSSSRNDRDEEANSKLRSLLFRTIDILNEILRQDPNSLSARQLCNAAWAIAKHYDRDRDLLPRHGQAAVSSDDVIGEAETWDLRVSDKESSSPAQRVDRTLDRIAEQLTLLIEEDKWAAKEGELCMASWAYGTLRPRRRPPGWQHGPQMGQLPRTNNEKTSERGDFVKFEQWSSRKAPVEECADLDPPTATDNLFDAIGDALCESREETSEGTHLLDDLRIKPCRWSELANLAWAYASHGRSCSLASEELLQAIASETARRLRAGGAEAKQALSRDIAQIIWSLGTLQSDNFRLADGLIEVVDALVASLDIGTAERQVRPFCKWSCADIVQIGLSLAHARLDEVSLLRSLYKEAGVRLGNGIDIDKESFGDRKSFRAWEICILVWAQARLYLRSPQGYVFEDFTKTAVERIATSARRVASLADIGIDQQAASNLAWSLAVLEEYNDEHVAYLLSRIFNEAAVSYENKGLIQIEHAHQLWQALFLLEDEYADSFLNVPDWFRKYLRDKWIVEKARMKVSSARHRSLSQALDLMGVAHENEHDEDIDVAIVLKPEASWTHEADQCYLGEGIKVAVEFDGPNHFTRQRELKDGTKPDPPRTLGHTVLKYLLLKKQGWTVVRVPYFEFDKIPFWASMERQRYLQRLLKTHGNIRFSDIDVSEYKPPLPSRMSRFD